MLHNLFNAKFWQCCGSNRARLERQRELLPSGEPDLKSPDEAPRGRSREMDPALGNQAAQAAEVEAGREFLVWATCACCAVIWLALLAGAWVWLRVDPSRWEVLKVVRSNSTIAKVTG